MRSSQRVPMPRRAGMRTSGERFPINPATLVGAPQPGPTRFYLEPHGDEILHDQAANLLGAIDGRLVEVAAVIVRDGGRLTVRIQLKDEELGLDPCHHLVAEPLGFRDLALQRLARAPGERRPIRIVDVADHPGDLAGAVAVREHPERLEVGPQHHVRLLDPHEALDRRAVEHDVALERLFELALGYLDVLVDAEDVGELEPERAYVLLLGNVEDFAFGWHGVMGGRGGKGGKVFTLPPLPPLPPYWSGVVIHEELIGMRAQ